MKVLIVDNSNYQTGAINSILFLCERLKDDVEFHFAIPCDSLIADILKEKSYPFIALPFLEMRKDRSILKYKKERKKNALKVLEYMEQNDIHILHVNDIYNQIGTYLKKKGNSIKLVQHVRLLRSSYIRMMYGYFAKRVDRYADKVLTVSEAAEKDFPGEAEILYNPLNPDAINLKYKVRDNKQIQIVVLGRLIKGKGQDYVLKAFRIVHNKNKNVRLLFVGGNPKKSGFGEQLWSYVKDHDLKKLVEFKDETSTPLEEMTQADILVNFSESESFSRVSLDALTIGIPLIASDCGGPRELFEHRKSGLLVDNRDAGQLAKAILKLAGDFELRQAFSENGKEFVREKFSLEKSAKQLEKVYKSLVK